MKQILLSILFFLVAFSKNTAQHLDSTTIVSAMEEALQLERKREYNKARAIYFKLLPKAKEANLLNQYATLLRKTGVSYYRSFELDSAIYWLEKLHQEDSIYQFSNYDVVYSSFSYLGQTYSRLKKISSSLATFKKSIEYAKKVEAQNLENDVFLARAYHNTGVALDEMGDLETSLIYMDSALYNLRESLNEPSELEARIYSNKGNNYKKMGYFEEAITYSKQEMEIYETLPAAEVDNRDWGLGYWYLGSIYQYRNASADDHYTALKYAKITEDYFTSIAADYPLLVYVYYQYAESYLQLGDYEKSEYYAELAENRNKTLYGEDFGELGYCYFIKARLAEKENDLDRALFILDDIIKLYEKINWGNFNDIAEAWYTRGNILLKQNKSEEALAAHQKALQELIPDFDPQDTKAGLLENPEPTQLFNNGFLFNALQYKAESLLAIFEEKQQTNYLEKAIECYELAYKYISLSREEVVNLKTKAAFSRNKFSIYEKGIASAFNAYQNTQDKNYLIKATYFADLSKSNNLLDKLQKTRQEKSLNIPASLLEKERQALSLVDYTEKQLYELKRNNADSTSIANLENKLFKYRLDYEATVDEIRKTYPAYYQFSKGENQIDIALLMEQIPKEQLYISYFSGENNTYAFTIGHEHIEGYQLPPLSEYNTSVSQLINAIQNKQTEEYARLGHELYQTLLQKPLHTIQNQKSGTEISKITLLPDASISYLPFDLLLSQKPKNVENLKEYPYLIKDYELSYHYSLNLLKFNQQQKEDVKERAITFLGFAPGFDRMANPLLATRSAKDRALAENLESLPGALEEVQSIAQFMNGKVITGESATETAFKKMAQGANYLHLATHTIIDDENPLYSKLIFSQEQNEQEDGLLYTFELYNMDLNAEMVSLSACNTATGKYYRGEGMVSLGSGFMYAGIPNVMMTAWAVSDASTSTIMQQFYKELENNESKAAALREAKLAYLNQADENLAHPYYWGAYMIIGNDAEEESSNMILFISGFLLALIIIGFSIWKKKAN